MKLNEYQRKAAKTDQYPGSAAAADGEPTRNELVPLLGMVGEVGTLISEYKKLLRDGRGHLHFRAQLGEELGDVLWYVSAVATKFGLSLDKIAKANLEKTQRRWRKPAAAGRYYDQDAPRRERLPRRFEYRVSSKRTSRGAVMLLSTTKGKPVGDPLRDNAAVPDGYRFHDVMHMSFMAILSWSPVLRKLLEKKRKYDPRIDDVEDGGRAAVIEEAIVATVFEYAERHAGRLKDMRVVDFELLRTVRRLTVGFEVGDRSEAEWEKAILTGFRVWSAVQRHNGGIVRGDMQHRTFEFVRPLTNSARNGRAKS